MIYEQAAALLAWYRDHMTAAARPPFERVHVSDGAVAFDGCPSLVVEHAGTRTGDPAGNTPPQAVNVATTLVLDWNVWAWRCVPVVSTAGGKARPPTSAATEASAKVILADRDVLLTATLAMLSDPGSPVGACQLFVLLGVDPVGPEGGLAGSVVRFAVAP